MKERKITAKLIKIFEERLRADEKSNITIKKYMRDLKAFGNFAAGKTIDKALSLSYKAQLEEKYLLTSANSMLAALNSFFRYVEWYDCCVRQFKIQKKSFCSEEKELNKAEYISLVETAKRQKNDRLSLLIETICGTGIRVSEVEYITVEAARKGEATVTCKGKSRIVFIVSALRKKLLRYAKAKGIDSGMIFITKNGKPIDRSNIWNEMKKLCKEAGVSAKKVFPHNLRHLFARTFHKIEKDIAKLADILGHSNINTTRIYIISSGAEHRRKMESMKLII